MSCYGSLNIIICLESWHKQYNLYTDIDINPAPTLM